MLPRRPAAAALRGLTIPTLVLLAGRSKSHDIRRVGAAAHRLMPAITVSVLPGASHHSLPSADPAPLNAELQAFLR